MNIVTTILNVLLTFLLKNSFAEFLTGYEAD